MAVAVVAVVAIVAVVVVAAAMAGNMGREGREILRLLWRGDATLWRWWRRCDAIVVQREWRVWWKQAECGLWPWGS